MGETDGGELIPDLPMQEIANPFANIPTPGDQEEGPVELPEIKVRPQTDPNNPPPVIVSYPNVGGSEANATELNPYATSAAGGGPAATAGAPEGQDSREDIVAAKRALAQVQQQQAQPTASTPVQAPETGTVGMDTPEDAENARKAITRAQIAGDKSLGSFGGVATNFNHENILPVLAHMYRFGATQNAILNADTNYEFGKPEVAKALEDTGLDLMNNPERYAQGTVAAEEFLKRLGISVNRQETYFGDAGDVMGNTLVTMLAMQYGAAAWTARQAQLGVGAYGRTTSVPLSRAMDMLTRGYHNTLVQNPNAWVASEILGSIGATVSGEEAMDSARASGVSPLPASIWSTMGGALGGAVSGAFVSAKVGAATIRVGKLMARNLLRLADTMAHLTTGKDATYTDWEREFYGMPQAHPEVDPDMLDAARTAESKARAAGDAVVDARVTLDKTTENTEARADATAIFNQAKVAEKRAVADAEKAWNMIPVEARGKLSRQQQALRAPFADTMYPREFTSRNVKNTLLSIEQGLEAAQDRFFSSLRDEQDPAVQAKALRQTLQDMWDVGKGIQKKYWDRANLDRSFPRGNGVLNDADKWMTKNYGTASEGGYQADQLPMKEFKQLRKAFGNIRNKVGLAWYKSFMTKLIVRADQAYSEGDYVKAGAYMNFHGMLYDTLERNFPEDVALAAAKKESKDFRSIFIESSLGQMYAESRRGIPNVRAEDTTKTLLKSAHAFNDIQRAVQWLDRRGVVNIASPDYISKADKAKIGDIMPNAEAAVRSSLQEEILDKGGGPEAAAKVLGNPITQRRVTQVARLDAEMQVTAGQLDRLMQQRKAIQSSSLYSYMEKDPEKGADMVWNGHGGDPVALNRAIVDGEAGVGGFRKDPIAMEGWKALMLDRLVRTSKGSPQGILDILNGKLGEGTGRGRLLKDIFSRSEVERLSDIAERMVMAEKEQIASQRFKGALVVPLQMLSLKLLHQIKEHVPIVGVGEGGALQQAALVSGWTKDYLTKTANRDLGEILHNALTNPAFEQSLWKRAPMTMRDIPDWNSALRRMVAFERATFGFYNNWQAYGQGPGPHAPRASNDGPLSWVVPSAKAGTVLPFPSQERNTGISPDVLGAFNQHQPGGYAPPANAGSVGEGVMRGNIKILRPDQRSENEGREQPPLYRGGQPTFPPRPSPNQPTPEGGPKGAHSELIDREVNQRSRAVGVENYHYIEENRKNSLPGPMPGQIGPGDKIPDLERGQGPGKRHIRVS